MNKHNHEITKITHKAVQIAEQDDNAKLTRTLASICGFSVNLYLMIQVVKDVSDISRLFFALLLLVLGSVSFKERDMSYLFGGLAVVYCPFILIGAGVSSISAISIIITIVMMAFMRGVSLKSIAMGASNAAIELNRGKIKKKIKELSGNQHGVELLEDEHIKEFTDIQKELDKVKVFYNKSDKNLKSALDESIPQIEELQKDHSRILMRSANLSAFLKSVDKNKIFHDKEKLELELQSATDDVVRAQLESTIKMKNERLEELKKLDTCLQRVRMQRIQINEMFSGTMDKMNALRFTDIQTLQVTSDAMFKNIKDIRSDLENLEDGLIEAEKYKKI